MLTVFVKTGCPYCAKVLAKLHELNIPFEEKNIRDQAVVDELMAEGGKKQVPFLEDDNMTPYIIDDDVEMYESDAIVAYLEKKFGAGSTGGDTAHTTPQSNIHLHVDNDTDVCESCQ